MRTVSVLIAEADSLVAGRLAASLNQHFRNVSTFASLQELIAAIPQMRRGESGAVVADLETISLAEVAGLRRDFQMPVVCLHRVPDDDMWLQAIDAGAADVCERSDVEAVVRALCPRPYMGMAKAA